MKLKYDFYDPPEVEENLCPIVFLHSMLESRTTWIPIAPEIARATRRKVYAIDARNHGESPWSDEYNIKILCDDLDEFLDQHQLARIILVGHSIGGKVAMEYTLKNPGKVDKLVLEDSPAKNFKIGGGNVIPFAMNMVTQLTAVLPTGGDREEVYAELREIGHRFAPLLRVHEESVASYDFRALPIKWNGSSLDIMLNINVLVDAILTNKMQQSLSGVYEGDVLFIYGSRSQFKAERDPLLLKFFPRIKKIELDSGHFIHQDLPKEYAREVIQFINCKNQVQSKI